MSRALSNYRDFLSYVIVCAPNDFPEEDYLQPHEQMTLAKAFAELEAKLSVVSERVKGKDVVALLRELLSMAHNSYLHGQDVEGAHMLQEFETIIWPSRRVPEKYAPLAKQHIKERTGA